MGNKIYRIKTGGKNVQALGFFFLIYETYDRNSKVEKIIVPTKKKFIESSHEMNDGIL